jgi:hypothetical protein
MIRNVNSDGNSCPINEGSICRTCGADLIHGLVVGMHAQGCEMEVLEKEIERLRYYERIYLEAVQHKLEREKETNG